MSNPYQPPVYENPNHNEVNAPAIALICVCTIAIMLGAFGLLIDLLLVFSGMVAELEAENTGPISEQTQLMVRFIWGVILFVAACFVLIGAIQMKRRKSYRLAFAAAVVASIPMVGPCCIVGIPFGIWAIVVLLKPEVQQSFS